MNVSASDRNRGPDDRQFDGDRGFTLIELLVVVVILGILIAIAIPVYLNYKKGANDKAALSDLRGAISVLELCASENNTYPATIAAGVTAGVSGLACTGRTINVSAGTTLSYYPATDAPGYILGASNANGTPKTYCFNSVKGGSITTTTNPVIAYRSPC